MDIPKIRFAVPGFETAKTVRLRGSWDEYLTYYPLVWNQRSTAWEGTITLALQPGQHRYHYLIDGVHYHAPGESSTHEDKIGNRVNILSIHGTADIPKGRPLSGSKILAPEPRLPRSSESVSRLTRWSTLDQCTCGTYGITRDGRRVKLSCGGLRCGVCFEGQS